MLLVNEKGIEKTKGCENQVVVSVRFLYVFYAQFRKDLLLSRRVWGKRN